ncbi:MAG: DUF3137 domain-containing protein [Acetobacter sp.]|nr:DUF3137 domain-containing protein [Acetobacter sp.]
MVEDTEYKSLKAKFDIYYEQKILPQLELLEQKRKKKLHTFCFLVLSVIIWCFFCLYQFMINSSGVHNVPLYLDTVGCVLILLCCYPMLSYYRQNKENLLPLLAGFFGNFNYSYQKKIPDDILSYSKIIKKYDKITTDDSFEGQYEGIFVDITEYTLFKRRYVNNGKNMRVIYNKNGQGVLFRAQMNKNFSGQTIVVKDKGVLNKLTHYTKLQRVGLESVEFEKSFEVYSNSQIEARYILTTVMLEYMLQAKKIFPNITFSFFNKEIIINIETNKDLFECSSFFHSIINKKRIEKIFTEFYYLFAIIKTLHLNQKQLL